MQLFVMRHGQASPVAPSDQQRPLTEQGFLEVAVMAKWLTNQQISFDNILVSPYIRAQQTAKHLAQQIEYSGNLQTIDLITPMGSAQAVHDYIDGIASVDKIKSLLLVSHMPLVSYLVEELTVEQSAPIFQTAGIAQIDYNLKRMKGELVNLISPNHFS